MEDKTPPSVRTFLAKLPSARREALSRVRDVIVRHLPPGPPSYEEVVQRDMLVYQVPLATYRDTYNGHPLWYVALGAPKSYLTLHLMAVYGSAKLAKELEDGFRAAGKKLNIGKACIHFEDADDLALDAIGRSIAALPVAKWVEIAKTARVRR